jgi:hypothetical protein
MADIRGFCWPPSALPGHRLNFYTATTAAQISVTYVSFVNNYTDQDSAIISGLEISEVPILPEFVIDSQPANGNGTPVQGAIDWQITFSLTIPAEWDSGVYAAKCSDSDSVAYLPFVVLASPGHRNRLLALANNNTWNAYNPEFGYNRYSSSHAELQVSRQLSYRRPHRSLFNVGNSDETVDPISNDHYGFTSKHQLRGELWVLNWLRESGYPLDV